MKHPVDNIESFAYWINNQRIEISFAREDRKWLYKDIYIRTDNIRECIYNIKDYVPRWIIIETKGKTKFKDSKLNEQCMIQRIIITNDEDFLIKNELDQLYIYSWWWKVYWLIEYKDEAIKKNNKEIIKKNLLKRRYW